MKLKEEMQKKNLEDLKKEKFLQGLEKKKKIKKKYKKFF